METVGLGFCFEDLPVGRRFKTIGRTVTEADITNFVNCTGMVEVLFTNLEFLAGESDIKGRLAPAALVYAFAEGLLVQSTMQHTGLAFLHMELDVENPVFAGDTIHAECEIVEARRSKSRPVSLARSIEESGMETVGLGFYFEDLPSDGNSARSAAPSPRPTSPVSLIAPAWSRCCSPTSISLPRNLT